jgi:hypothetical protein
VTLALHLSCDGRRRGVPCRSAVTFGPVDPEHPTATFADAQATAIAAGWRRIAHHLPAHLCPQTDHDEEPR